ncbi:MAG: hypothetical protein K8S55_02590 [Phycisphaerae bacterium]|nr:hypothetical protein [Phycisphaerae bacterium]
MKKNILFFVAMLLPACGCAQTVPSTPVPQLYHPGQDFLLVFHTQLLDKSIKKHPDFVAYIPIAENKSADSSTIEEREVERKDANSHFRVWLERELPLQVVASDKPGCVAVSMKYRRHRGSGAWWDEDGRTREESFDTAKKPPADDDKQWEHEEYLEAMRTVSFSALVNAAGKIVEFDAKGGNFYSLKKDNAEDNKMSEEQKQLSLRLQTGGVFNAMADTMAYLPPIGIQQGQQWHVRREKVLPYRTYEFYMLTDGCVFSTEQSTCLVKSIKQTPAGRVATIEITGRRVPYFPEFGMSNRVKRLDISGRLLFNLDTVNIIDLRIESIPRFLSAEDRREFKIKFVDSVKLCPLER